LGHTAGYNRVDGYTVTCNGATYQKRYPSVPTVIQR
ncbi:MAG: hypothetical protein JWO56_1852, partial [Acidobacteria bacterium]|nr:hypothetical protein [Acidobacteriota bacterium]